MITEFRGEYSWLSNFHLCIIKYGDYEFSCVENAYQSAKNNNPKWKKYCSTHDPKLVKKKAKKVPLNTGWDDYKFVVMYFCLSIKFAQEPFRSKLLSTGDELIQEGNNWGDKYWGVCLKTGKGKNALGKLLMSIRNELRLEEEF